MNDATIQPGRRTWLRFARDALIAAVLLGWFFGTYGTPFLRVGEPYRLETGLQAEYLSFTGTAYFPSNGYGKHPLIILLPLQNSIATDVWRGLVAIKEWA